MGARFAFIHDFDEYIIPRKPQNQNLSSLLREISGSDKLASQYSFVGKRLCSGCSAREHGKNATACGLQPRIGFSHLLGSSTLSSQPDHIKSIVDPRAVTQAAVHSSSVVGRTVTVDPLYAFKGARGPDSLPGERQGESECRRARE